MSGVQLRVGFADDAIRMHLLRLAALNATGYDQARSDIGEYLLGEIQDNLDGQKLFDGSAMPQSKAAIARRGKTLIDKHHLYDSYVRQLVRGGLEVGSNRVYAAINHFGGETGSRRGRFTMTARPVMGIGPAQERRIGDILVAEIEGLQ